ncbi:hypothetical protein [Streptomyces sp. NP-1717]|uniref:hypothetical protein n=1 Tax=Streptomyces sp. NP-1717 TaxID=2704470 RepID=UPI001F5C6022|nr:hypothetical protein [Streptomyces sp. NP-1717]MCI3223974.1 hypothetical protein [Streptomyces sp. NP-1717]
MRQPRQFYWQGMHVPFITPWTGEQAQPGTVVLRTGRGGQGIGYADELSHIDRRYDALWIRRAAVRGLGKPDLAAVHPHRQRQAMSHMLCQVCGTSTFGRPDERHLFLMRSADGRPITDGEQTATPPVCEPCAIESVGACPHLRKGYTAALVDRAQMWGVAGIVHDPDTLAPVHGPEGRPTAVSLDSPLIRWTLAACTVVTLHGCTTVDLERLTTQKVTA